jgi:hypothetical protein
VEAMLHGEFPGTQQHPRGGDGEPCGRVDCATIEYDHIGPTNLTKAGSRATARSRAAPSAALDEPINNVVTKVASTPQPGDGPEVQATAVPG